MGLCHTQMCNSAPSVLPLGPCSHSMVHPVPLCCGAIRVWCWAVCALIPPASEQAKVGALVLFLSLWATSHDGKWCPWISVVAPLSQLLPTESSLFNCLSFGYFAIKTTSEGSNHLPASPCLVSKYWGAKPGGQHQHSPGLAALQYQCWEGLSTRPPGLRWGSLFSRQSPWAALHRRLPSFRPRGISSPATWEVPWVSWQASTQQGESPVRQRKGSQLLLSPGSESSRTLHSQPFSLLCCRGSHEPGVLLSHVPDRAVPLVEVSHLCGCADLGIFHICCSCLCPLLWYGGAASDRGTPR